MPRCAELVSDWIRAGLLSETGSILGVFSGTGLSSMANPRAAVWYLTDTHVITIESSFARLALRGRPGTPEAVATRQVTQGERDLVGRRSFFRGGARPSNEVAAFMAAHRHHGVMPICRVLQVAPSAVRSAMARPVCARPDRRRGGEARARLLRSNPDPTSGPKHPPGPDAKDQLVQTSRHDYKSTAPTSTARPEHRRRTALIGKAVWSGKPPQSRRAGRHHAFERRAMFRRCVLPQVLGGGPPSYQLSSASPCWQSFPAEGALTRRSWTPQPQLSGRQSRAPLCRLRLPPPRHNASTKVRRSTLRPKTDGRIE